MIFHFSILFFYFKPLPPSKNRFIQFGYHYLAWMMMKSMAMQNTLAKYILRQYLDCIEFNININAPSGQSSDESGQRKNNLIRYILEITFWHQKVFIYDGKYQCLSYCLIGSVVVLIRYRKLGFHALRKYCYVSKNN